MISTFSPGFSELLRRNLDLFIEAINEIGGTAEVQQIANFFYGDVCLRQ
jgi:hypothetical protein